MLNVLYLVSETCYCFKIDIIVKQCCIYVTMDANPLIYLAFIVEEGSFQAASRRLAVSKATLSRNISALETDLGVQLLNRTTRKLSLTEAGTRIFPSCLRLAEEYLHIKEITQEASTLPRGDLRMTAPITAGRMFLSRWLAQFTQAHPQIRLQVNFTDEEENLVEQRYDLALRVGELKSSTLISRPLAHSSRILCLSASWPGWEKIINLDDLHTLPKIVFKGSMEGKTRWRLHTEHQTVDLDFQPQAVLDDMSAILEMVKAGGGLSLVPTIVARPHLIDHTLRQILPDFRGEAANFHLVYLRRDNLPRKTRLLIDFLVDCAQRDQAMFETYQAS